MTFPEFTYENTRRQAYGGGARETASSLTPELSGGVAVRLNELLGCSAGRFAQ